MTTTFVFDYEFTADEFVALCTLVAQSPVSNGLASLYGALYKHVLDKRGLSPENIHYTRPAWSEETGG